MDNISVFLDYQDRWSEAFCNGNFAEYRKIAEEGLAFRNKIFTKSDWEQLIAQSSGRAKYEYTKMMKEKFPD